MPGQESITPLKEAQLCVACMCCEDNSFTSSCCVYMHPPPTSRTTLNSAHKLSVRARPAFDTLASRKSADDTGCARARVYSHTVKRWPNSGLTQGRTQIACSTPSVWPCRLQVKRQSFHCTVPHVHRWARRGVTAGGLIYIPPQMWQHRDVTAI